MLDRLGVGYEVLRGVNPRLVYCAISGYGQDGPLRSRAGHDLNYLARTGVLALSGEADGPPVQAAAQIADLAGGALMAAFGILAALRSGEGQFVDISMADGALSLLARPAAQFLAGGAPPRRGEQILGGRLLCYRPYRCADGHVSMGRAGAEILGRVLSRRRSSRPDRAPVRPGHAGALGGRGRDGAAHARRVGGVQHMVVADSGNGASNVLDWSRYLFINTELSVHFLREPVGEWVQNRRGHADRRGRRGTGQLGAQRPVGTGGSRRAGAARRATTTAPSLAATARSTAFILKFAKLAPKQRRTPSRAIGLLNPADTSCPNLSQRSAFLYASPLEHIRL